MHGLLMASTTSITHFGVPSQLIRTRTGLKGPTAAPTCRHIFIWSRFGTYTQRAKRRGAAYPPVGASYSNVWFKVCEVERVDLSPWTTTWEALVGCCYGDTEVDKFKVPAHFLAASVASVASRGSNGSMGLHTESSSIDRASSGLTSICPSSSCRTAQPN